MVAVTSGSLCCVCVHALCHISTTFLAPLHTFTFLLKLQVERDIFKILKRDWETQSSATKSCEA
jgi:hypothetical protein